MFASSSVVAGRIYVATQHDIMSSLSGECNQVSLLNTFYTFMKHLVLIVNEHLFHQTSVA